MKKTISIVLVLLMIFGVLSLIVISTNAAALDTYPVPQRTLSLKSSYMAGSDIKWVQTALNSLGYNLKADGVYGPLTYAAVKKFQSANFLIADGYLGGETLTALFNKAVKDTALNKAFAYAKSQLGNPAYDGYCQKFVRHSFQAGGISSSIWPASALAAYKLWCVSTRKDNIPVGAVLFFTSSSKYGHVGIYVGNGKMIHAGSTVREEKISSYWWDNFLGWGYYGGTAY